MINFLFNKNIKDVYGIFVRNYINPITYFAHKMVYSTFVLRALSTDLPLMKCVTAHKVYELAVIVISTFVKRSFIRGCSRMTF